MVPILVMELRGFADMATQLSREIDEMGIDPERVRASGIDFVNKAIEEAKGTIEFKRKMHIGGDTWYFNFHMFDEAFYFAIRLLRQLLSLSITNGLYYLKPSIAIGFGDPKFQGDRFLDDDSINTYRVADNGKSFNFFAVGNAVTQCQAIIGISLGPSPKHDDLKFPVKVIDWRAFEDTNPIPEKTFVNLPVLLLDSDVVYSDSPNEAVNNILRQQAHCKSALVFGGPVPFTDPIYRDYLRATLALLSNPEPVRKWTVLSYLPINELLYSYAWLELCRRLSIRYPDRYAFAAFTIPEGQLRPFSYHIYDSDCVHVGLRSFSTQRGTPTLSSSIMFKNRQIATRFSGEFMENFRSIGALTDDKYAVLLGEFGKIDATTRASAVRLAEQFLTP